MFQDSEFSISCFATGSPNMEFLWYRWWWAWLSINMIQLDPTWSETLIYVDALQWSETTAWSTSLWPTGSWRRLCITSRLVIIFDLLSAWSSSWCNESKIGSFWFSKWWSPVHCCRSSGCANCGLCAQHWLRGFQVRLSLLLVHTPSNQKDDLGVYSPECQPLLRSLCGALLSLSGVWSSILAYMLSAPSRPPLAFSTLQR